MWLLTGPELDARRRLVAGHPVLQALARGLRGRLDAAPLTRLYLPAAKARLTRDGGVCSEDGSRLIFEPDQPHRHRCPRCARVFEGDRHHAAWLTRYHLWLSERAIHLALLGTLDADTDLQEQCLEILGGYARIYPRLPNRDNVLGPTRIFFSTYLESIWLLQLVTAARLLQQSEAEVPDRAPGFNELVAESAGIIGQFHESFSNRQVWNDAALIVSGLWLDRQDMWESAKDHVEEVIRSCISDEGLWYEGENYHFFALRGLQYVGEILRSVGDGWQSGGEMAARIGSMYLGPLNTLLPDLTLPARGDSPFGVSVRQMRFAELWEVGWTRTRSRRLAGILNEIYQEPTRVGSEPDLVNEISEFEQNREPYRVSRSDLGWKALLWMDPEPLPTEDSWNNEQFLSTASGLAVVRPGVDRYLSLDFGGRSRGGHGHPDGLQLNLFWDSPLILDFGTASYVSPTLAWYRSAGAHNGPCVMPSRFADGRHLDSGTEGRLAWLAGETRMGTPEVVFRRVVLAGPGWVLDWVEAEGLGSREAFLPLHLLPDLDLESRCVGEPAGEREFPWPGGRILGNLADPRRPIPLLDSSAELRLLAVEDEGAWICEAPGPPDLNLRPVPSHRFILRSQLGDGAWRQLYLFEPRAWETESKDTTSIGTRDGSQRYRIEVTADGFTVEGSQDLKVRWTAQRTRLPAAPRPLRKTPVTVPCPRLMQMPELDTWREQLSRDCVVTLSGAHYRRSEEPYPGPGLLRAELAVFAVASRLAFVIEVVKSELVIREADAPDPRLDNENPDIHSDGVQLYVGDQGWYGYLLLPVPGSRTVRSSRTDGSEGEPDGIRGEWHETDSGYMMMLSVQLDRDIQAGDRIPFNIAINEMRPGRERRSGQLVLSGGGGWVYLRGDREPASGAAMAEVR